MRYFFSFLVAGFLICNYSLSDAQLGYLEFISSPNQGIAGEYIPFIIQRKNTVNEIITSGTTTINLSQFGTFTPNPVIIGDGTSTAQFYYYQEKAGSWSITASCEGITVNTSILIEPAEVDHLTFITIPATITVKTISPVFRVQRQDRFDNPVTKGTLELRARTRSDTKAIFLPEFITIRDGASIGEFYYYGESYGSPTIRIAAFGVTTTEPIKAAEAKIQVLLPPPYVKFIAENIPTEYQYPGTNGIMILKIFVENFYFSTNTITSIKLTNVTQGLGSQSDLDSQISKLYLYHNSTPLGSTTFISATARFDNLCISIPKWGSTTLSIFYDLSLKNAKDGDIIDIQLEDVTFATTTTINANFPLNSYGHHIVNGMVSSQIDVYDVATANFKADKLNNLVLDIIIPANGYTEDTLKEINIENSGTADENDILLKLWVNDKNLEFSTTTATFLGTLSFTGEYWQKSGINYPIGTLGLRTFITTDIKEQAGEGKTIKIKIPTNGIELASNNDGPIDTSIENKFTQYIKVHNKVIFEALDLLKEKVNPGDKKLDILNIAMTNYYTQETKTLTSLTITNTNVGTGNLNQLDSQIDTLYLYDGTNTIGISNYKDGKAGFSRLNLNISPGERKELKVKYDISLHNAKDDNIIDCSITSATDINFKSGTTSIGGIFPLDSSGFHKIDGLVNAQITNYGAKAITVATGTINVLVLDVLIPSNGYAEDTLTKMRIKNSGTAKDSRDIKVVKLCIDANTYTATWSGEYWEWTGTISIPYPGKRVLIFVDVADESGGTIMMKIPVNGLEFLSDNDGPIDSEVINPYVQTISKGLLSSLKLASQKVAVGGTVTIIMEVVNTSTEDIHTLTPTTLILEGSGSATLITAPEPHSTLPAGSSTEFIWTYKASSYPGTLAFTGYVTSTTLSSIPTYSEILYIQNIPEKLVVTHIPTMPFEVNKGQSDIVPMSIIFKNPATASVTGDIAIGTLTFNLGTIPNRAMAKIKVSRAGIIYGSKTDIETSGTTTTLKTSIVIPPGQAIAVNLIIEIPTSTTTDRFQIALTGICAQDVNSNVKIDTIEGIPIESGYTNIKTQSQGINVNFIGKNVPKFANRGQKNVLALQIEFKNEGENVSEVKVTQFTLVINNGTINSNAIISKVMIKYETFVYEEKEVSEENPIVVFLSSAITLPSNIPKVVDVIADVIENPLSSEFHIGSVSILAKDTNTGKDIPVSFGSITTSSIKFQVPAQKAIVTRTATIPTKIYQGQQGISVFELIINNPGTLNSASILLKEVALNIPQTVNKIMIGDGFGTYSVTGTQNLTLITPATITPQTTLTLNFKIDILSNANLGEFKLDLFDVKLVDANDLSTITHTFLPISVTSQIKEKPTGLLISYQNNMPVNVAKGDKDILALTLTFKNQGGTDTDEINIGTISLTVVDRFNNPILANKTLSKIILSYDGTQTIKTNIPPDSNITIKLTQPLKVGVDKSKTMEIKIDISSLTDEENFKISVIDVKGTDNWANPINISGTFPMWSESTTIFKPALDTSFTNYPNPFAAGRESTTIAYYLPQDGYVTIKIYTVIGDLVITLLDNVFKSKGMHQEDRWDGRNGVGEIVLNGVYFCQIKVNYTTGTSDKKIRKIAVVR